jgi:hypothetical protein
LQKLSKFKEWLTVPDAARHLSTLFGEDVSEADVLRLALDRHLTLSVDFVNGATAQCGKITRLADAEIEEVRGLAGEVVQLIKDGVHLEGDKVFSYSENIKHLTGIWNLAMVGAERLDVEDKYHSLTGGPPVESVCLEGPFVYHTNGVWARIVEYSSQKLLQLSPKEKCLQRYNPENYYPAARLPSDAVLIVRTSALQQLAALISEPDPPLNAQLRGANGRRFS